jgi:hypothetical protein
MTFCTIENLLREQQTTILRERRSVNRQPFVRPLEVQARGTEPQTGFSRDVSRHGISLIARQPLAAGTIATLRIHSVYGPPMEVRAEVRWCDPFGDGWFLSGWYFLDSN